MTSLYEGFTPEQIAELEVWRCAQYGNVRVRFTEGIPKHTKRRYMVSVDGGKEVNRPSVSTIVDKHFAKDVEHWHEKESFKAAGTIVGDVLSQIGGSTDEEAFESFRKAIKTFENLAKEEKFFKAAYAMGLTPTQIKEAAGLDGDILHAAVEGWFEDGEVPNPGLVEADKRGKMQSLAAFLYEVRPELIASEPPIYSALYGYTGRPDLLAKTHQHIPALIQVSQDKNDVREGWLPPGTILFDFKSGNKLWANHGIQLAMYEQGLGECGFPDVDWRVGVHLRDDGYVLHAFPDSRSAIAPLIDLYNTFKSLNRQKPQLNKSLLIEPEVEAVA